ncbi:MAG: flagellar biosynthesis protein FlhA [Chloroflexota bacterium]
MATQTIPRHSGLSALLKYSDIVLAVAVVMIVAMMIVPLPADLLDVLLTLNISAAMIMLLVSMYILEPLQFSVFPSLLLIATLFRLALNVSSTRLILLQGYAGHVIESFGGFVVGGSYVVGVVVFMILVIIQFVVITNGAGRVAEVAARFTLDAMPGKQMSIDADLNAGLITENEARRRRRAIEQEADFYGAMDGASKFVKGDAIAGIIIIFVNILGGLAIGVLQNGMDLAKALQTYTLLTIGDGLVTQIPALLISTATGIIVTRAASESNLGMDVSRQLMANPRALAIVGGILFLFGLIPGLPKLPFFAIAAALGGTAYYLSQREKSRAAAAASEAVKPAEAGKSSDAVTSLLQVDPMELEIGYGLVSLVDETVGGSLVNRIAGIRRQLALEMGIILPSIRIRDNLQLAPSQYVIKLRGVEIARGEIRMGSYLALNPGTVEATVDGIPTTEPAFGLPALWIGPAEKDRAELLGYTVVDANSVITTHLTEVIKLHAPDLLTRQDVQTLINNLRNEHSAVVEELIPNLLTLGEVQKVLQGLLRERVPIRDLVTILETLADHARATRDTDLLTEYVRQALARLITAQYREADDSLHVMTLSPHVEQVITESLVQTEHGTMANLEPSVAQRLIQAVASNVEKMAAQGRQPVVLCSPKVRLPLRRLVERSIPNLIILSFGELSPQVKVHSSGMVDVR